MALYFGTTEITNIDNLVPQTSLDITDIWFGSTNVYTVWATYEGTPPATINANGDNMKQYQIHGNTGGVGDDSGTAYGYKLDMVSIDDTKIPEISTIVQGGWNAAAGTIPAPVQPAQSNRCRSTKFYPINGTKLIYNCGNIVMNIVWIAASGVSLGGSGFLTGAGIIDVKEQAKKITFIFATANTTSAITPSDVIESSPTVLPSITTPIYIGDEPLEKDEYVDYQAQKVYRMINGTLTPTDPPIPLPALPTVDGTTVVDYAGNGTAPEKVLLKYRKEGY